MKKFIIFTFISVISYFSTAYAKDKNDTTVTVPRIGVKLNSVVLVGIVNPAVEFSVHRNFTVSLETFGCFYPNGFAFIKGKAIVGLAFLEGRWYPKNAFRGFFIGPNVGYGVWSLTKGIHPMYWGQYKDEYQVGSNFMVGITLGYMFSFSRHWGMEISAGGGYSFSQYNGHVDRDGSMYIGDNISTEWLPYKAALSVVYKW